MELEPKSNCALDVGKNFLVQTIGGLVNLSVESFKEVRSREMYLLLEQKEYLDPLEEGEYPWIWHFISHAVVVVMWNGGRQKVENGLGDMP